MSTRVCTSPYNHRQYVLTTIFFQQTVYLNTEERQISEDEESQDERPFSDLQATERSPSPKDTAKTIRKKYI